MAIWTLVLGWAGSTPVPNSIHWLRFTPSGIRRCTERATNLYAERGGEGQNRELMLMKAIVSIYARLRGTAVYDRTNPITVLGVGNLVPGLVYYVGQARGGSFRGVDQKRRCTTAAGAAGTQL